MKEKTKGTGRKNILILGLIGLALIIILSSIYIYYLRRESDNVNEFNGSDLTLTLSFDQDSYNMSKGAYINGTLTIKNFGPTDINISNDFEHGKGIYVNITEPDKLTRVEKFYSINLIEPIILKNDEEIIIPFNIYKLDRYRAPTLFTKDGEYSIHFFYEDVESNNINFNLSH
jgi:hypothetical protein